MAIVTGFTSERMLAIENTTIISGTISGNNLMLNPRVGAAINAGNVRGPTGSPGVSTTDYNNGQAAMTATMNQYMPAGVILDYPSTTAPSGWLTMVGQTITNGQTLHPALWAVIPASMKSGANIVMPDTRGRVTAGYNSGDTDFDAIGDIGGSKTQALTRANLPTDTITIDPPTTIVKDMYGVGLRQGPMVSIGSAPTNPAVTATTTESFSQRGQYTVTSDDTAFESAALGSGTAHNNMQPFITFLKIIKAV